jgi:4-amino-4-deoxychorismate lyase
VFETTRVYGGRPFRLAEHLARLERSAESLGLPVPDGTHLAELAGLALGRASRLDAVLRLYWTPGPPGGEAVGVAMVSEVPGWIEAHRARGQRLVSLLCPRRSTPWLLPGVKSVSYAVNIAAEAEAKRRGADDALFVDADGIVLEGTVTNVWWREADTLVTPSLDLGILAGETRAALLGIAHDLGWIVREGAHPLARLAAADEAFTSSAVREVMPVIELDGRPLGRGPAADALQQALRASAYP